MSDDEPGDWEHARDDKFDRGIDVDAIEWAVFSPGMHTEFRIATRAQILAKNSPFFFDAADPNDVRRLNGARPGDWIRYKEGIAIRLGRCIEEYESWLEGLAKGDRCRVRDEQGLVVAALFERWDMDGGVAVVTVAFPQRKLTLARSGLMEPAP